MSDDFESLAAKGRAERAGQPAPPEAKAVDPAQKRIVERSLGWSPGWGEPLALFGLAMLVAIAGVWLLPELGLPEQTARFAYIGAMVLGGVLLFVVSTSARRRRAESELSWLRGLPFTFDLDTYLTELGEERMKTRATVRITFAAAPGSERDAIADAARGAAGESRCAWSGEELVVTSPPIDTWFRGGNSSSAGSRSSRYNNGRAHRWVRAFVDGGVRVIHERHPLDRVEVTFGD